MNKRHEARAVLSATAGQWTFFLEKWYFDTILEDGTLFVVLIGHMELFGLRRAHLSAELHRPDGTSVRGDTPIGRIVRTDDGAEFSGGVLTPTSIEWQTPVLSGRLRIRPRVSATSLRDPLLVDEKILSAFGSVWRERSMFGPIEPLEFEGDGKVEIGPTRCRTARKAPRETAVRRPLYSRGAACLSP